MQEGSEPALEEHSSSGSLAEGRLVVQALGKTKREAFERKGIRSESLYGRRQQEARQARPLVLLRRDRELLHRRILQSLSSMIIGTMYDFEGE